MIESINSMEGANRERWVATKLSHICEKITKGSTPTSYGFSYQAQGIRFVKTENINQHGFVSSTTTFIDEKTNEFLKRSILQEDDLLFSIAGTIGRVGLIRKADLPANTNQALAIIRPLSGVVDPKFLFYYLISDPIQKAASKLVVGVGRANLSLANVGDFEVPLAPPGEQKRIVAEIEQQFSRLDGAIASLNRAKANLKRYKAAVLKAAVEGKLTEQWRKEHPDVEPASKLLERILTERRIKWEATELAKIKAKGKESKRQEWKARYKPEGPHTENLPAIPSSWTWATLPQLGEMNRGKSKHRPRNDPMLYGGPYPFIQTGDIRQASGVISKYTQTYSEEGLKQSRMWPKGTLCITIAANIANTAILGFDACFPDSVVGFIQCNEYTDVRFIEYFFRTAQKGIEKFAPATAQKNINLNILSRVAIPLPPPEEQQVIIEEIERRLSVAEEIERSIEANKVRTDHFRQSILKKAFSGRLVLQIKNQSPN